MARRSRAVAISAGLVAVAALAVPSAHANTTGTFSANQLSAASDAVLGADMAGTAWNVDPATKTLRVTVDSTVSQAEIKQIKKSAGANSRRSADRAHVRHVQQAALRWRRHLRPRLALFAGLQRPQRQHLLLPDRRSLHRRQPAVVHQLVELHEHRPDGRIELPDQ